MARGEGSSSRTRKIPPAEIFRVFEELETGPGFTISPHAPGFLFAACVKLGIYPPTMQEQQAVLAAPSPSEATLRDGNGGASLLSPHQGPDVVADSLVCSAGSATLGSSAEGTTVPSPWSSNPQSPDSDGAAVPHHARVFGQYEGGPPPTMTTQHYPTPPQWPRTSNYNFAFATNNDTPTSSSVDHDHAPMARVPSSCGPTATASPNPSKTSAPVPSKELCREYPTSSLACVREIFREDSSSGPARGTAIATLWPALVQDARFRELFYKEHGAVHGGGKRSTNTKWRFIVLEEALLFPGRVDKDEWCAEKLAAVGEVCLNALRAMDTESNIIGVEDVEKEILHVVANWRSGERGGMSLLQHVRGRVSSFPRVAEVLREYGLFPRNDLLRGSVGSLCGPDKHAMYIVGTRNS